MKKCPKCGSSSTKIVNYLGTSCLICNTCGYDETAELDTVQEQKTSQKAKSSFSPYKTGGKNRTRK